MKCVGRSILPAELDGPHDPSDGKCFGSVHPYSLHPRLSEVFAGWIRAHGLSDRSAPTVKWLCEGHAKEIGSSAFLLERLTPEEVVVHEVMTI